MKDEIKFDIDIEGRMGDADRKTMKIPVEADTQLFYDLKTGKFFAIAIIEDNEFKTLEVELEEVA